MSNDRTLSLDDLTQRPRCRACAKQRGPMNDQLTSEEHTDIKPEMDFHAEAVLGTGKREWNIVNGYGGHVERFVGTKKEADARAKALETRKRAGEPYYER
jgi:hypothetical protein